MIKTLFKIRFYQFFRLMSNVGTYRLLLMLFVLCIVGYVLFLNLKQNTITSPAIIFIGIALLFIHIGRRDKNFLKSIGKYVYFIFLFEYLFLVIPFLVVWIVFFNWIGVIGLLLLCFIIPLIDINLGLQVFSLFLKFIINPFSSSLNFKLKIKLPFIRVTAFEWISGIRQNFFILVPMYLLILIFSIKLYVAPIGILLISLIVSGFYYYGEPREFIELYAQNARQFILKKIINTIKYLLLLFLPIVLVSLVFQIFTWYLILAAILISFFVQIFTIIFKYALFEENASLNRNSVIAAINIIFIIVPLFWPVPIIMGIRYYFKALQNLKQYFYA